MNPETPSSVPSKTKKAKRDRETMAGLRSLAERFGYKPCVLWLSEPQREAVRQFVAAQGWSAFSLRDTLDAHGVPRPKKGRKKAVPASAPSPKEVAAPAPAAEIAPRHVAESVAITPAPKPTKPKVAPSDMSQLSLFDAGTDGRAQGEAS